MDHTGRFYTRPYLVLLMSANTEFNTDREEMIEVSESTDEDDPPDELSDDVIFGLLKNQRRREALRYLHENGGSATRSELAEHIAAKENDTEPRLLSSDQRKRVYIGLYQCHLPKMNEVGVIEYDKNRGTIELRDVAEDLLPYVRERRNEESSPVNDSTSKADASTEASGTGRSFLSAIVLIIVFGALLGVPGLRRIPDSWLAGLASGALLGVSLADTDQSPIPES